MSSYFKLFRLKDALLFYGANTMPTAAFIYACLNGLSQNGQAFALMLTITICFWLGYLGFILNRKHYLSQITYVTKQDVAINTNGFDIKQTEVEALIDDSIIKWNAACKFDRAALALDGLLIEFRTYPVSPDNRNFGTLAGYLKGGKAVVGYKTDLKTTAFQHELGHAIYHEFTGLWDNEGCHKFMSRFGLL